MKQITIVGAGLAGTLLSLYLANRGYEVCVIESRPDIRNNLMDVGRSINLSLSCRGISALTEIGVMEDVDKIIVPMRARAIHENNGEVHYQSFGRHEDEYINAVIRTDLNKLLLDKADENSNITIKFDTKILDVDFEHKQLLVENNNADFNKIHYQRIIAADGAASVVREALKKEGLIEYERKLLPHGYKELTITKQHTKGYAREHLHLWPRDSFMLLGNPNRDESITGSLFMPNEGKNSFKELDSEIKITSFFKREFRDVYEAVPNLVEDFFNNPTGNLGTVSCSAWHYQDQCLLIGDAAHGIVPFFGQGMNSAFEDCHVLNQLLDQYDENWHKVMPNFYNTRKPNTDAVASMSMANYEEIQSGIRDPQFNLKKKLEHELMLRYPGRYISKHVLVMFTNIPYAQALVHGELQASFLDDICEGVDDIKQMDWLAVNDAMKVYDKKLAELI